MQWLHFLSLDPLQLRRLKFDLCMVYKIWKRLVHLQGDVSEYFERSDCRMRGSSYRFRVPYCQSDVRKNIFPQRIIAVWNSLPECVVCSPSLVSFKTQLYACHDLLLLFVLSTAICSPARVCQPQFATL